MSGKERRKEKESKISKYNKAIIALIYSCFGAFLIVGLVLDIVFYFKNEEAHNFITALSADSLLAVVAVIVSVILVIYERHLPSKYNIDYDDYNRISDSPTPQYIHMLIISSVLIFADAFFYVFDCRYSLLMSFVMTSLLIFSVVIPNVIYFFRAENRLLKKTSKHFNSYTLKYKDWAKSIYLESQSNDEGSLLNRVIEQILLYKGFSFTENLLLSNNEEEKFKEQIYLYLKTLLFKSLTRCEKDRYNLDTLSDCLVSQYLENTFSLCLLYDEIKKLNDFQRDNLSFEISDAFYQIDELINIDKISESLRNVLYQKVNKIIEKYNECYENSGELRKFYLSIIINLFSSDKLLDNHWLIDFLVYFCNGSEPNDLIRCLFFVLFSHFSLLPYYDDLSISITSLYDDFSKTNLKYYFKKYLFDVKENTQRFKKMNIIYSDISSVTNAMFFDMLSDDEKHSSYLFRAFEKCSDLIVPFLLFTIYGDNIEEVDDYLFSIHPTSLDKLINNTEKINDDEIESLGDSLVDVGVFDSLNNIDYYHNAKNYILNVQSRRDECTNILSSLNFDNYTKLVNDEIKKMDFYEDFSDRSSDSPKVFTFDCDEYNFVYLNKKDKIYVSNKEKSFMNPKMVYKRNIVDLILFRDETYLGDYSDSVSTTIGHFKPDFKDASHLKKMKKDDIPSSYNSILNIPDKELFFRDFKAEDIFYKDGAFNFCIKINQNKSYVRRISRNEAILYLKKHNPKKSSFDEKTISETQDNIVCLYINVKSQYSYDTSKFIVCSCHPNTFVLPCARANYSESLLAG